MDKETRNTLNTQIKNAAYFKHKLERHIKNDSTLTAMEWDKKHSLLVDGFNQSLSDFDTTIAQICAKNFDFSTPDKLPEHISKAVNYYQYKMKRTLKNPKFFFDR